MNTNKGFFYILISAFFYGTYGVWSRFMAGSFGEFSQAWTRAVFLLALILVINAKKKLFRPIKRQDLPWFIAIALAGGMNQAPYFFGFEHLGVGTATLLFYAALVTGGYLLGKLFFGEVFTRHKIVGLAISFFGMFSIYQLSLSSSQYLAASLTIIAGLLGASTVILPKKLLGNYHELQIMSGYFIAQILFNLPFSLLLHNPLPAFAFSLPWLAQLGYAISLLLANYAAIEGYRYLEPSIGSLLGLTEILVGITFGIILFQESLTLGIIIGGVLILLAAILPHLNTSKFLKVQP